MKTTFASRDAFVTTIRIAILLSLCVLFASCQKRQSATTNQPVAPTPTVATNSPAPQVSPAEAHDYFGTGIVTKVVRQNPYDKSLASVELNHGEIVGLMPAMRMEFYVKDVSLLNGLKVGDLVDFTIEENGGTEIITEIKKK